MNIDYRAGNGARPTHYPSIWSDTMNLMNEALARAHCTQWPADRREAERQRQLAHQLAVARAQRSARWAERFASYAANRAEGRRRRVNLLSASLR